MPKLKYVFMAMTVMLVGCWDVVNLEDRGFVVGTAIDIEEGQQDEKHPYFKVTNQLVTPAGVHSPGVGGSGGEEEPFVNITASGRSIFQINEELAKFTSKIPFFEHMTILVISERVAETPQLFSQLLDTYIRDVNLRRGTKVVVAGNEPIEIFEYLSPENKLSVTHIDDMLENSSQKIGFFRPVVVGELEEYHLKDMSYILPILGLEGRLEYKAGAVFHGVEKRMVGILSPEEMHGLEMVLNRSPGKVINFLYEDEYYTAEIVRIRNKIKADPSLNGNVHVTIDIQLEGTIKEAYHHQNTENPDVVKGLQDALAESVTQSVEQVIHKAQKDLNADIFNISRILETRHYDTWVKIRDNWEKGENYFSHATFDINVDVDIYSVGTINRTD